MGKGIQKSLALLCLSATLILQQEVANAVPMGVERELVEQITLKEAFSRLTKEYNVYFTYDQSLVNDVLVDFITERNSIDEDLSNLLVGTGLQFKIFEDQFVIIYRIDSRGITSLKNMVNHIEDIIADREESSTVAPLERINLPTNTFTIENNVSIAPPKLKGVVLDDGGEPLIGVNIGIKGSTIGTATDLDGQFELADFPENSVLVLTYIGYQDVELNLNDETELEIIMYADEKVLDEIVVVGYGSVRKSDLTGAVSSVGAETFEKFPVTSLEQGLQGRAAGVQVTQTDAAPGGAISIRIRGGNSITGNNEPLYVIDGYPMLNESVTTTGQSGGGGGLVLKTNPLSSLNPNDIASVEILKDASATAVYGARGANGVVIITTKRGKANVADFDFSFYTGIQEVTKTIPVLDLRQYAELANEAFITDGQEAPFPNVDELVRTLDGGTDWQKEIFRIAPTYNAQASYTGGTDKTRYMLSANYFTQDGVVIGSNFDRIALRLNLDSDATERLKLGYSMNFSFLNNDEALVNDGGTGSAGVVHNALTAAPYLPIYDEEGNYFVDYQQIGPAFRRDNPVALALSTNNNTKIGRALSNVYAEYKISDHLQARVTFGADVQYLKRNLYIPRTTYRGYFSNGIGQVYTREIYNWLNENTLSYSRSFGGKHELNVLAGFTVQEERRANLSARGEGFVNDILAFNALESSSVISPPPSTGANKWSLQSFIGRINYGLQGKYLLTLTARSDGSSRFGANNKWGFFPSGAIAWRVSEESFMKNLENLSTFKLRASYGLTGNQEIPLYRSQASLGTSNYILGNNVAVGISPNRLGNPDLKWETTSQFDIGLDLGILNERYRMTIDYYHKKTTDLLLELTVPWTSGYSSSLQNVGSTSNEGFELSVGADVFTGALNWKVDANVSLNRNKVLDLGDIGQFFGPEVGAVGFYSPGTGVLVREGEPVNSFFGYVTDGLFRTQADIDNAPAHRFMELGDVRYKDINGDGVISPDDRTFIGTGTPDFIYGFNNYLSYKNFDFTLFIQGVKGGKVLNVLRIMNWNH